MYKIAFLGNTGNGGDFMDKEKKEKQLEDLVNTVERHTRTERHLEQYSNIGNQYGKEEARKKQSVREKQIVDLKDNILEREEKIPEEEQLENLVNNYESAEGYLNNNIGTMSKEQITNMEKRQMNRRIQMQNIMEHPSDGEDF